MGWEQRMIERERQRERDKGGYKERRKQKGRREQNWIEKGSSKKGRQGSSERLSFQPYPQFYSQAAM